MAAQNSFPSVATQGTAAKTPLLPKNISSLSTASETANRTTFDLNGINKSKFKIFNNVFYF